ncbi:MAG TPA: hypothetical protein VMY05_05215 [Acidobacteriota bacterium]|nr:hypothetical protein [Acidobacteriota bacterium]
MKRLISVLGVLGFLPATGFSQLHIVLDSLYPEVCGGVLVGDQVTQTIAIANPEQTVQDLLYLGFKFYCPEGTVGFGGLEFYNDLDVNWYVWSETEPTADGHGFQVAIAIEGQHQFPADTIPYIGVRFSAYAAGGPPVCIDSAVQWGSVGGLTPTWSGEKCYATIDWPVWEPIGNCPPETLFTVGCCDPIEYLFYAGDPDDPSPSPSQFQLVYGPGQIENYFLSQALYTFTPGPADAGMTYSVGVRSVVDLCGDGSYWYQQDGCDFFVTVAEEDDPVAFVHGQQQRYSATTGDTLKVKLAIEDDGPCADHRFSYIVWPEDPEPPGFIDSLTGIFYYYGASADTNLYWVSIVVSECGGHADTMGFYIYHSESYICGDCDHNGIVDIGDLTLLIGYLFLDDAPPTPAEAGNVDCVEGVDIGDLTRVIDYLFISHAPLCNGCE